MHITDNFIILWTESLKSCQSLGLCGLFISSFKVKSFSHVRLFVTPWTVAHQVLLSTEWVAISFSGEYPDPGIEPGSPALRADALPSEPPGVWSIHFQFSPRL